jgi:hypothetical protein
MPGVGTAAFADTMNVVSADVQRSVRAGRKAGLTQYATALAGLIGVISMIRVDGLDEDSLFKEARRAVPRDRWQGGM